MNEQEELEQWQLIHVLQGQLNKPGLCELQCGDPVCSTGCLRRSAHLNFRADIMHGVEIVRKRGDPRFPLVVPTGSMEHCKSNYCHDPVCLVVGCMETPGFNFRDLIKIAQEEKLWKVLKK